MTFAVIYCTGKYGDYTLPSFLTHFLPGQFTLLFCFSSKQLSKSTANCQIMILELGSRIKVQLSHLIQSQLGSPGILRSPSNPSVLSSLASGWKNV